MAACSYHILRKRCEHFLKRSHVPRHNRGFKENAAIYIAKKHRLCCCPSPFAHPLPELCHVPSHHLSTINNVSHTSHDTITYAHPSRPGSAPKSPLPNGQLSSFPIFTLMAATLWLDILCKLNTSLQTARTDECQRQ